MQRPIDIIIPVYRGEAETRRCVRSVLDAACEHPREVVVIDDAGPEPALSAWLRELAAAGAITLIAHTENRGFVASVIEGMALHGDRDVILLNSDTQVAPGWVDRLAAHASRDTKIGTATPFSNNATLASYPRTLTGNAVPEREPLAQRDAAFAAANAGVAVDVPTGVGFCLFISRRCLDAVGPFDLTRYGRGYGEEVDFCMRAARAGLRNVVATDVFVEHVGEVSFGGTGMERRAEAQAMVDSLYPEFQPRLRELIATDPLRPARRRADVERLRRSRWPRVLLVTHAAAGGVRRHVEAQVAALAANHEVLVLQPNETSPVTPAAFAMLRWANAGEEFRAWFRKAGEWPALVELLAAIGISRIHFHHVHGLPPEVLALPQALACPHGITFHDYHAICPQYHLVDGSGRYCEEPGLDCRKCEERGPAPWPLSIPEWRAAFASFVRAADVRFAPSQDSADRMKRYFPSCQIEVVPHESGTPAPSAAAVRVVVPGAISVEKGLDLLEACVRDAATRGLPLHFIVAGYLGRPLPAWPEFPLVVTGEYPEGALPRLLGALAPDVLFFPAQCPETYSFTLTDALATGCPVLGTDLGAIGERLRAHAHGEVVPWDESPATINSRLLSLGGTDNGTVTESIASAANIPVLPPTAPRTSLPSPPAMISDWWLDPREPLAQPTLAQLYDDGVLAGRRASRDALRARAIVIEADREHARRERDQLAQALAAAREEILQHRRHADAVRTSTSWRLTAPLRWLVTALRRGR